MSRNNASLIIKVNVSRDILVIRKEAFRFGEAFPGNGLIGMCRGHYRRWENETDEIVRKSTGEGGKDDTHIIDIGACLTECTWVQAVGDTVDDKRDADEPRGICSKIKAVPVPVDTLRSTDEDRWDVDVALSNDPIVDAESVSRSIQPSRKFATPTHISMAMMGQMKHM